MHRKPTLSNTSFDIKVIDTKPSSLLPVQAEEEGESKQALLVAGGVMTPSQEMISFDFDTLCCLPSHTFGTVCLQPAAAYSVLQSTLDCLGSVYKVSPSFRSTDVIY